MHLKDGKMVSTNMSDNEGLTNPADYQVDAFVDQLDRNAEQLGAEYIKSGSS